MQKYQYKTFIVRLLSFATIVLMLSAAAILRDSKLFGYEINANVRQEKPASIPQGDTIIFKSDGGYIINTKPLAKDIQGYGGPVPLKIHVNKKGHVEKIEILQNAESPDFFNRAREILRCWQGKSVSEAMRMEVDGVSGATFSSKAIIGNMKRGLTYAYAHVASKDATTNGNKLATTGLSTSNSPAGWTAQNIAALIVALLGAIVPMFTKSRRWHYVQQAINTIVLGLWTGTFVSYALFMRLFANGISMATFSSLAAPLVMVIVAIVYPLTGHNGHYCAHMCPLGAAQELAGKITKRKPRMSVQLTKRLTIFRKILWGILMVFMLTGTWTAWVDYELFTSFLYTSAPIGMGIVAMIFLIISIWIQRPYCRFICPTGYLIKN